MFQVQFPQKLRTWSETIIIQEAFPQKVMLVISFITLSTHLSSRKKTLHRVCGHDALASPQEILQIPIDDYIKEKKQQCGGGTVLQAETDLEPRRRGNKPRDFLHGAAYWVSSLESQATIFTLPTCSVISSFLNCASVRMNVHTLSQNL